MKGSDKTDGGKGLALSRAKYLPEIIRKLKTGKSETNSTSVRFTGDGLIFTYARYF